MAEISHCIVIERNKCGPGNRQYQDKSRDSCKGQNARYFMESYDVLLLTGTRHVDVIFLLHSGFRIFRILSISKIAFFPMNPRAMSVGAKHPGMVSQARQVEVKGPDQKRFSVLLPSFSLFLLYLFRSVSESFFRFLGSPSTYHLTLNDTGCRSPVTKTLHIQLFSITN